MTKITRLAKLFSEYKLYPLQCFDDNKNSIANIFQKTHKNDDYSKDLIKFLEFQNYMPEKGGADLPFWGNKYFSDKTKPKIMIISRDTNYTDAGSVVFHACLWTYFNYEEYKKYMNQYKLKIYKGYRMSRDLIKPFGFDRIYITDALKIYSSRKNKDKKKSMELLEREIRICDPDLIVLLGKHTMKMFGFKENFGEIVGKEKLIKNNKPYIIAPFPSGNNRLYNSRVDPTKKLFMRTIEEMKDEEEVR